MAKLQGPYYEALGKKIADARRKARINQGELARVVGLSRTSIVNIERGRQPLQVHALAKIASTLGTPVATLLPSESQPMEPQTLMPQLQNLGEEQRQWVARIIKSPELPIEEEKVNYGSEIRARKKESSRASHAREGKTRPGTS